MSPVAYFLCLLCTHSTAYNDREKKKFKTTLTLGHCQLLQTGFQAATSSFTQLKVKVQCVVSWYLAKGSKGEVGITSPAWTPFALEV